MDTDCGVSVNLTHLPSSTTPLHIVLWKGVDTANPTVTSVSSPVSLENDETIKRLLHRISALESMVSGLLETQKSSIWFPQGLRPTPAGIDVVSRRESMGGESDIGTVLSQLVRPSDVRTVSIAPRAISTPTATGPQSEADATEGLEETEAVEETQEEAVEEAQEEAVEEAQEEAQEEAVDEAQEEAQEEAEAVEEEEIVEYKEVQWKGKSYFVDDNQQAYEMDSDGDLIETPVGIWKEETQKLVRYKTA